MSGTTNNADEALESEFRSRISKAIGYAKNAVKNRERNKLILTQVLNALLGLIIGKLLALYIVPEELGAYNLQFGAFTFFFGLFISPLLQYKKASYQKDLKEFGYRNFTRSFILYGLVMLAVLFLFFRFYHSGDFLSLPFFLILCLIIPVNYFSNFMSDQFNILGRINIFSIQSVINNFAGALFIAVMLFLIPSNGSLTLWTMQIMTGIFGILFFAGKIHRFPPVKTEAFTSFLKKQSKFTVPLIVLAFFSWINNYFDRYVIEANLGLEEVGIYNVNYGLGAKFFTMLNPIFLVLLTPHIFQPNTLAFKKSMIRKYLVLYLALGIFLVLLIYLFHGLIGRILLSAQYEDGFYIIYLTAFSSLLLTSTFLIETLLYSEHRTRTILWSNIVSALMNVLLNLLLIPIFGMTGAILASIISVAIRFIYCIIIYRKI